MSNHKDWRSLFVGRETEIAWLQDGWHKAQTGQPQLRVLRGESGLGKTKVVQELYAWLSQRDVADPEEYWPAQLIAGDNLRLNPDLETQPLGDNMRYLWWGLRWLDPGMRNQEELTHCAFFDQRQMLQPHWQHLSSFKDTARASLNLGGEIGNIALDLAKDTALNLFPLLGIIKTVADIGGAVRDVGQAMGNLGNEFDRRSKSAAEQEAEELAEQIRQIVAFLGWVLKPFYQSGSGSMPVVLVLDDAQWMDTRSLDVVQQLFAQALEQDWPLLVVVTHWEREWHEALINNDAPDNTSTASVEAACFAAFYASMAAEHPGSCELIDLSRLREEKSILQTAFSGLTTEQTETLKKHADGNARLLTEIILFLESEPDLFQEHDLSRPLDDVAFEELELEMSGFKLNQLQERRFKKLPAEIRGVLALASLQGMRFLADLVNELGRTTGLGAPSACAASLGRAEHPYAIISSSGLEREFRFAIFHEFARQFLPRLCRRKKLDTKLIQDELLAIATERLGSSYFFRLTDSERENLLLMILQSGEDSSPGYVRALLHTIDHYRITSNRQRGEELLVSWQALAGDAVIPFNGQFTALIIEHTPFYRDWVVFSLDDYGNMPGTRYRYATDGNSYRLIDGSAECIHSVNHSAMVAIDELTAMAYLRFYFANICFDDGSTELIESGDAEVLDGVTPTVQHAVAAQLRHQSVTWNEEKCEATAHVLLAQRGSLFSASLKVGAKGQVDFTAQTRLTDTLPRFANHHWLGNASDAAPRKSASEAILDGAVRPPLTAEQGTELLEEAKRILALTEQAEDLLIPWEAGDIEVRVFDASHELTAQPNGGPVLYIGMARYRPMTQERITLLAAFILLDEILTREGRLLPSLTEPKEDYVRKIAQRRAHQVARLCCVAFDLSLQEDLKHLDFIAEMHAMGYGESMDTFIANI